MFVDGAADKLLSARFLRWQAVQDDDQEGCDRPQEQRQDPPVESAAALRLSESGVDQSQRAPADRVIVNFVPYAPL